MTGVMTNLPDKLKDVKVSSTASSAGDKVMMLMMITCLLVDSASVLMCGPIDVQPCVVM